MRIRNLIEGRASGTFVGARLTPECNARLAGWMAEHGLNDPEPIDRLHITIVLDGKNKIPYHPRRYNPPIPVDPDTYSIDLFGPDKDILVLRFESPQLEKLHRKLRKKFNIPWDFDSYNPHITLTKSPQIIASELDPPRFALEIDREYIEEFS